MPARSDLEMNRGTPFSELSTTGDEMPKLCAPRRSHRSASLTVHDLRCVIKTGRIFGLDGNGEARRSRRFETTGPIDGVRARVPRAESSIGISVLPLH